MHTTVFILVDSEQKKNKQYANKSEDTDMRV